MSKRRERKVYSDRTTVRVSRCYEVGKTRERTRKSDEGEEEKRREKSCVSVAADVAHRLLSSHLTTLRISICSAKIFFALIVDDLLNLFEGLLLMPFVNTRQDCLKYLEGYNCFSS